MLKDKIVSGEAVNIMDLMKVVLYRKGKNFEVIFNDQIEEKNLIDLTFEKKNPKKIQKTKKNVKKNISIDQFEPLELNIEKRLNYYESILGEENEKIDKEIIEEQIKIC